MERPEGARRGQRSEKKIQKTLILVFEVIVQPLKAHFFLTFSSETKITHSAASIDRSRENIQFNLSDFENYIQDYIQEGQDHNLLF